MSTQQRTATPDAEEVFSSVGGSWLWVLAFASITLAAGVMVLVWPEESARVLAIIIGLQFLAIGVARFITAFSAEQDAGSRVLYILLSLLSILAGVLCLRHQLQAVTALALIVGALWLVSGIALAYMAIADRDAPYRGLRVAAGALLIVAGIIVLGFPTQSVVVLARLIGLWHVLLGLFDIGIAIAMRVTVRRAHGGGEARE